MFAHEEKEDVIKYGDLEKVDKEFNKNLDEVCQKNSLLKIILLALQQFLSNGKIKIIQSKSQREDLFITMSSGTGGYFKPFPQPLLWLGSIRGINGSSKKKRLASLCHEATHFLQFEIENTLMNSNKQNQVGNCSKKIWQEYTTSLKKAALKDLEYIESLNVVFVACNPSPEQRIARALWNLRYSYKGEEVIVDKLLATFFELAVYLSEGKLKKNLPETYKWVNTLFLPYVNAFLDNQLIQEKKKGIGVSR